MFKAIIVYVKLDIILTTRQILVISNVEMGFMFNHKIVMMEIQIEVMVVMHLVTLNPILSAKTFVTNLQNVD